MNILVKLFHGSRLYGTNHNSSDIDIKGIYQPDIKHIILEQDISTIMADSSSKKMQSHDIDMVFYSISKYFELLNKNAMQAIEILFASHAHIIYQHSIWKLITSYRKEILNEIDLVQSGLYFSMILNEFSIGSYVLTANSAKNLSHAMRIVDQCLELNNTKELVFPRQNSSLYRQISTMSMDLNILKSLAAQRYHDFNKIQPCVQQNTLKNELLLHCYGLNNGL